MKRRRAAERVRENRAAIGETLKRAYPADPPPADMLDALKKLDETI